jgi:hypothetical protein
MGFSKKKVQNFVEEKEREMDDAKITFLFILPIDAKITSHLFLIRFLGAWDVPEQPQCCHSYI